MLLADHRHTGARERGDERIEGRARRHHDIGPVAPEGAGEEQIRPQARPPRHAPVERQEQHGRQAPQDLSDTAGATALVVCGDDVHPCRERNVRRVAVAHDAQHGDVVAACEVAGDVEARPRRAAHAPGMAEQDEDASALSRSHSRRATTAHGRGQGCVRNPVGDHASRPQRGAQQCAHAAAATPPALGAAGERRGGGIE